MPVYYLGKSIQSDGYSCYLIACLFARFFLAKDSFGKYDAPSIISFFERFSKKSCISNGAYEIKKMPEELLIGCQKQNVYQKLSASIV